MPLALLALAISAFGIGTTEFVTNGLLPEVADDLSVSIPTAGLLTSGYAMGVVVGAPVLTAVTTRMRRKHLLIGLMVLFIAGNLVAAVAPNYALLMGGRIISALCHGAFFGVGSVVAANLVSPQKKAGAISLMFTGLTLANVLGMPMGTLLGQHFGWRSAFWGVVALGVIGLIGIAVLVPNQPNEEGSGLRGELAAFRKPQVWLGLAVTAVGFSGLLASFTYVAPMMTDVAGFSDSSITWLLMLYGLGLVVGNYAGGKAADRALTATIFTLLIALAVVLTIFTFTAHNKVSAAATLFVLGGVGFGTIPPLQTRVMQLAGGPATLVSAANIAAFNLGAAVGAWLGGVTIDAGLGYTSPNWVGAIITTCGIALAVVSVGMERRKRAGALPSVTEQPVAPASAPQH
ncbi:MFS transporter [Streptomyces olivoreticuli]|uniref:MFS transporter n=1 Tax=Streptomyces olivoreticuli TaxID=68246 RepID=UPI00265AAC2E|nr:MFS transporter [Streptomyces olivoreticuli]WKK25791.1 MFS transporter [Streptomyces olivoreticuli]